MQDSSSTVGRQPRDRVSLDVGGHLFTTSISTLRGASAYFSRLFSQDWESTFTNDATLFLDRDADAFKVLLSCMRNNTVLLPENDLDLCSRVLLEAQYFGADWLIRTVKQKAVVNSGVAHHHTDAGMPGRDYQTDPAIGAEVFDERFGGGLFDLVERNGGFGHAFS
jgi:hypothetical protein